MVKLHEYIEEPDTNMDLDIDNEEDLSVHD